MGEIAAMMLDGTLCESCGVFLGQAVGYPRKRACCGHIANAYARSTVKVEAITLAQFDLHQAGLSWVTNNDGIHLQVYNGKSRVGDLWPTTGKFIVYIGNNKVRGVGTAAFIKKIQTEGELK